MVRSQALNGWTVCRFHGARGGAPQAPQHPSPAKPGRAGSLENGQPRLKADKDRKLIIEPHFADLKSLL